MHSPILEKSLYFMNLAFLFQTISCLKLMFIQQNKAAKIQEERVRDNVKLSEEEIQNLIEEKTQKLAN